MITNLKCSQSPNPSESEATNGGKPTINDSLTALDCFNKLSNFPPGAHPIKLCLCSHSPLALHNLNTTVYTVLHT